MHAVPANPHEEPHMPPVEGATIRTGWTAWATRPLPSLTALWLLGLLAFWAALSGPWLFDDAKLQTSIAAVHSGGLPELVGDHWQEHLLLGSAGMGRFLSMASLAGNALIGTEPFGFKLANLLLHLVVASLVYLLLRVLLATRYAPATAGALALAVALAWTLHPLQMSTVAYVVQRMTILSALFAVWAMLIYARKRGGEIATGVAPGVGTWLEPLLILPALAVLAKENGALIPVMLLTLELALFRLRGSPSTRRLLGGYFGLVLATGLGIALWLLLVPNAISYAGRAFDMDQRLLTQTRVVTGYVGQILLPRLGDLRFYYDGLSPSTGWLSPPTTLASAAFLSALLGLGLGLIRRRPLASFGILFFFAGHLLESTLWPLELAFEHRNYLPSLGLILAAADLLASAGGVLARWRTPIGGLALAMLFALCLARAFVWSDAQQIYLTALGGDTPSPRARAELAQRLTELWAFDGARAVLKDGRGLGPRLQEIYLDCREEGRIDPKRIDSARAELGRTVGDYETTGLILIANLAIDRKCVLPQESLLGLLVAAATVPVIQPADRRMLWMYVGHLRQGAGDTPGAVDALESALRADPINPLPLLLAALWQLDAGDADAARALYGRARAIGAPGRLDLSERFREVEARLGQSAPGSDPLKGH
jgi:protein O-mannosyl-transferase